MVSDPHFLKNYFHYHALRLVMIPNLSTLSVRCRQCRQNWHHENSVLSKLQYVYKNYWKPLIWLLHNQWRHMISGFRYNKAVSSTAFVYLISVRVHKGGITTWVPFKFLLEWIFLSSFFWTKIPFICSKILKRTATFLLKKKTTLFVAFFPHSKLLKALLCKYQSQPHRF